jgi:Glyoxalase superfamily protein/Clp amino terminal domain, pathogenicity island component
MRDFRDAKDMAHTLRAALATKGLKITVSQSLELIAEIFGVADWNTLAAAIRAEGIGPRNNAPPPQFPTAGIGFDTLSRQLMPTMHRALAYANQRDHQYTTLEHLLLALIDDRDASGAMKACKIDLGTLRGNLTSYIDNDLKTLITDDGESRPTAAFQRVFQRAVIDARSSGRQNVTGADMLVAIFAERESHAAYFLQEQEVTSYDVINYLGYGIVKGGGDTAD